MIRQFKFILIYSILIVSTVVNGQDSIFSQFDEKLDSLHKLMKIEMDQHTRGIRYHFNKEIEEQNILIDSLLYEISSQKEEYKELVVEKERLVIKMAEVNQSVLSNELIMKEEHSKFKRILLISGPSILALVILSAVLFFVLIINYKDQTDKKISALKKYTHSEMEDTRNVLLSKLKKRLKKFSKLNIPGQDRDAKSKKKQGKSKK